MRSDSPIKLRPDPPRVACGDGERIVAHERHFGDPSRDSQGPGCPTALRSSGRAGTGVSRAPCDSRAFAPLGPPRQWRCRRPSSTHCSGSGARDGLRSRSVTGESGALVGFVRWLAHSSRFSLLAGRAGCVEGCLSVSSDVFRLWLSPFALSNRLCRLINVTEVASLIHTVQDSIPHCHRVSDLPRCEGCWVAVASACGAPSRWMKAHRQTPTVLPQLAESRLVPSCLPRLQRPWTDPRGVPLPLEPHLRWHLASSRPHG